MSQVRITVSGTLFEFNRDILQSRPFQKLPQLVNDAVIQGKSLEFMFDRPSGIFTYILSYYQTGELHMPTCVCPDYFEKELRFWEIEAEEMSDCCYYRYARFLNDFETQKKFKKETLNTGSNTLPMVAVTSSHGLASFRRKVWHVVDSNTTPLAAKIYFALVISMVLLSIGILAFSTEASMRRPLNKCELLEYLEYTSHPDQEFIKSALGNPACSGDARSSSASEIQVEEYDWVALWQYYYDSHYYDDYYQYYDDTPTETPGTTSATASSTESSRTTRADYDTILQNAINQLNKTRTKKVDIPSLTVPLYTFDVLERITMAFFTLDLIIRLFSCPSLKRYFMSFLNIVDACALISSYIYVIVLSIKREYRYENNWVRTLEYLQIFRVLRLFRVVQNVRATQVLLYSMWQNLRDITLLGFLLVMAVSLFSTVLYFAEDSSNVESIPQAWYWAVVTLTTVGYGDISPRTYPGRLVASACAVCGVILLAVTLPIFVNNFLVLYEFSCVEEANENRKSKLSKTPGFVRDVSIDEVTQSPTEDKTKNNIFTISPLSNKTRIHSITNVEQLKAKSFK